MAETTSKVREYGDFQASTFKTRVTHMEVKSINGSDALILTLAHHLSGAMDIRLKVFNRNGLLTAYQNGNLIVGQELIVAGSIQSVRSFYTNADGDLVALKFPEILFNLQGFDFGAKPKAFDEAAITANSVPIPEVDSTLETTPPVVHKVQATAKPPTTEASTHERVQQRFGRIKELKEVLGEVEDHALV